MDLFAFIQVADPTKVDVGERERAEEEAKLLDSTVGRVVPLLLVAPARLKNELEARVERLFDEGGSADQVDFANDGGQEVETGIVTGVRIVAEENVVAERPKRPQKKRQAAMNASDSSRHSSTHASEAEGDFIIRSAVVPSVITKPVVISHAANVSSVPKMGVKVTSPIREMDYHHLFTEFNVGIARQASLNAEVRMRMEYCLSEKKRLESEREKQADLATEAVHLRAQVSASEAAKKMHVSEIDALKQKNVALESTCARGYMFGLRERLSGYKNLTDRLEEFQNAQLKVVNDKVAKLDADLAEMACHLEKLYPHLLTTISGQSWLITHGLKLVLVKCLNSSEYLTALRAAISRAIKKGMQDDLAGGIDHGKK
nr:hypothetical protein [Tanacetum cinerariifolium]